MTSKRIDIYHHRSRPSSDAISGKEVRKCGLCNGTGKDSTMSLLPVKCSACGGKGWVRV